MKKKTVMIYLLALVFLLTACQSKTIEITMPDGSIIEIETKDLSKEQIEVLEQIEEGEIRIAEILQSGLFTKEELDDMGLTSANKFSESGFPGRINPDLSNIDINDLKLEGLTDTQIEAIKQLIAGEKTIQEITSGEIITIEQLISAGLLEGGGIGNRLNLIDEQ